MRIWALGDIHANAAALRAALARVDADPADRLVILGDLLTYGPEPAEVLELVAERVARGAELVLGNHDALYLELARGEHAYYDALPAWIRASADWTLGRIDGAVFAALPFNLEAVEGDALYAHANPWARRPERGSRWAYLNSDADHRLAAQVLRERGLRVGVFGHTHRGRIVEIPSGIGLGDDERVEADWRPDTVDSVLILNAGSVGQPRNPAARSTLLEAEVTGGAWHVRLHPVAYDIEAHIARLMALPLPAEGRAHLVRFHRPRGC